MPFPLASPSEGSYREAPYQARIELYAQNHFTPAEYQKIKTRGITFCRGDADNIRHAFIGEHHLKHKVQEFTGSAYVYDLAHGLLLQIKRTVQQLVNVPEGLDIPTLMSVLFNLRGYKLMDAGEANANGNGPAVPPVAGVAPARREGKAGVQLTALSSTDFKTMADRGGLAMSGRWYVPIRVPNAASENNAQFNNVYPWSTRADGTVAVDCVVAQMLEICRAQRIPCDMFSLAQRTGVFAPLELDRQAGPPEMGPQRMMIDRQRANATGLRDADMSYGFRNQMTTGYPGAAVGAFNGGSTSFANVIRTIQLTQGSSFGPTSVAGLDEVFRMEAERDGIIAMLTQWGTTGMGIILDRSVPFDQYRSGVGGNYGDNQWGPGLSNEEAIMGNRPAYANFAAANGMGDACGPGYSRLWFTGDPGSDKSKEVPGTIVVNGVEYQNPRAKVAVCAPMTRQLRSMPYTKDVITNPVMGVAAQRRSTRRKPRAAAQRRTKGRKTTRRRR